MRRPSLHALWRVVRRATAAAAAASVLAASLVGASTCAAGAVGLAAADAAGASGVPAPAAPVVLVGGWGGTGDGTWGARDEGAKGLFGRLCRAGYRPGETLFVLDDAPAHAEGGLDAARAALTRLVADARLAAGVDRVDIVTYGAGALLARACAEGAEGAEGAQVRNIIMIAPPNRGSSFAAWVRLAGELERQAAMVAPVPPDDGVGEGSAAFDAASYVAARAAGMWAPLYDEYLSQLATREAAGEPEPFEAWLKDAHPDCFSENIAGAVEPPAPGASPASPVPPYVQAREGAGLSRAFYELLAINVARYRTLRRAVESADALDALAGPALSSAAAGAPGSTGAGGLWRQLFLRLALWLGRQLERFVRDRGAIAFTLVAARRDGIDPRGPYADALVPETLLLPGCGPGGQDLLVPANVWLGRWNAWEEARRAERDAAPAFAAALQPHPNPRCVVIAGRLPFQLPACGLPPAFRPPPSGDLVVAPADTLLQPCANDIFVQVGGPLALHPALPLTRGVQDEVLRWLGAGYPEVAAYSVPPGAGGSGATPADGVPWQAAGACSVVAARPAYIAVDGRAAGDQSAVACATLRLAVEVQSPRQQWAEARAWAYIQDRDGATITRRELAFTEREGLLAAGLELPGFGRGPALVRLGLRVFARGPAPAAAAVALGRVEPLAATFRLTLDGASAAPPAAPPTAGGDGAWGPATPTPGTDLAPRQGVGPLIRVKLKTKHTTLVRAAHWHHARWEWDFGDGGSLTDDDPGRITCTASHRFAAPGRYTVRASSYDQDGAPLRRQTWEIEVPPPPEGEDASGAAPWADREFTAQTFVEPDVEVELDGPRQWMAGVPAQYWVRVRIAEPPFGHSRVVSVDPGEAFQVLWERPGHYLVAVAVTVETAYAADGAVMTRRSTWLCSWPVVVLAPALGA